MLATLIAITTSFFYHSDYPYVVASGSSAERPFRPSFSLSFLHTGHKSLHLLLLLLLKYNVLTGRLDPRSCEGCQWCCSSMLVRFMLNRDKPCAVVSLRVNGVPATPQSAGNFPPGHHLSSAEFAWQLMKKERNSPLTKSLFGCRHDVPEFTLNDG